jgi:hypothetical protein
MIPDFGSPQVGKPHESQILAATDCSRFIRAFSSEVGTGSRQETRQIKNLEPRSDSIGTEEALPFSEQGLSCASPATEPDNIPGTVGR